MDDVELTIQRQLGIDQRDERRQLRRLLRNARTGADALAIQPFRASIFIGETISTTDTTTYQPGLSLPFELPAGEWDLHIRVAANALHTSGTGSVAFEVRLDDVTLLTDSRDVEVADRSISWWRSLTTDETIDGGSHTLQLRYRANATGTAKARNLDIVIDPTRVEG